MSDFLNNPESNNSNPIQMQITLGFSHILNMVKYHINIEGSVLSLERGLISSSGDVVYRDYFEKTHGKMREEIGSKSAFSITKINLSNGKEIILSTNFQPELRNKNIIFLDDIKEKINPNLKPMLEDKMREIHYLERDFFKQTQYKSMTTEKEIFDLIK